MCSSFKVPILLSFSKHEIFSLFKFQHRPTYKENFSFFLDGSSPTLHLPLIFFLVALVILRGSFSFLCKLLCNLNHQSKDLNVKYPSFLACWKSKMSKFSPLQQIILIFLYLLFFCSETYQYYDLPFCQPGQHF